MKNVKYDLVESFYLSLNLRVAPRVTKTDETRRTRSQHLPIACYTVFPGFVFSGVDETRTRACKFIDPYQFPFPGLLLLM